MDAWSNTSVSIVNYVPHARRELIFTPVKIGPHVPMGGETFEAAAEVELTAGDTTRSLWLQRGDGGGMPIPVKTSDGTLAISYGYESLPLGFSLQLKKFTRGMNPGGMGDARFASTVHLHDEAKHIDQDHEISMNEPLAHGKYTFYQSGILPSGTGTVLTVASDPGLFFKYLGSIMTCAGTLIMFVTRSRLGKALPLVSSQTTKTKEQLMRRAIAASLAFFCLAGSALAASSPDQQFDWNAWRSLPVQDGGRQKPLDSLAWETWRLLGNRVSFTDPETNQALDATAFYVATLLDSPTWDKNLPSPSGRGTTLARCPGARAVRRRSQFRVRAVRTTKFRLKPVLRARPGPARHAPRWTGPTYPWEATSGMPCPCCGSIPSSSANCSAWRPIRSASHRGTCRQPRSSLRDRSGRRPS